MRIKDLVLIGGAALAGFKWIYLKPLELETKYDNLQNQVNEIALQVREINKKISE